MATPSQSIIRRLIAWRWYLLGAAVVLAAVSFWPARQLGFDRSIEAFFAADDPLLPPYRQLKRTFGGNEVVLVAYVDPELMTDQGLDRLERMTIALSQVEGVATALSLMSTPLGKAMARNEKFQKMLEGYAVSADRQTAGVVCILKPQQPSEQRTRAVENLREIAQQHDPAAVLAGEPVMVEEGFRTLDGDGKRLGWISNVLLMGVILLSFRSLRWVVIPLAVVQLGLVMTQALLVTAQLQLSMVSSMLWAIITVVAIGEVVHIIVVFRDARAEGALPRPALESALSALAWPLLWSILTTVGGFASLLAASVGPIQDFGLMMALGTLMAMLAMSLVIPGLALAGRRDIDPRRAWGEGKLDRLLRGLLDFVLRRPWTYTVLIAAISIAGAVGGIWLEVETDFTRNFRASSRIVRAYGLVETRLGGAGVWDIVVPAPEKIDAAFLKKLRKLQDALATDEKLLAIERRAGRVGSPITKTLSLADAVDVVPVPPFGNFGLEFQLNALQTAIPAVKQALHGRDAETGHYYARIMLRARERQPSRDKQALIRRVSELALQAFPAEGGQAGAQVTGFFVLLANLIQSLVRDQWLTMAVSSGAIYVMMLAALRNLKLSLIAMAPNMVPIMVLMGIVGWLEYAINMGAVMIAAVSMGMSIDSSIHYLIGYQRLRRDGHSAEAALHIVQQSEGRAATLATLALIAGFSALCFSEFVPIVYFGALVSLALIGGLWGNIVLLPLLLYLAEGKRKAKLGTRNPRPLTPAL